MYFRWVVVELLVVIAVLLVGYRFTSGGLSVCSWLVTALLLVGYRFTFWRVIVAQHFWWVIVIRLVGYRCRARGGTNRADSASRSGVRADVPSKMTEAISEHGQSRLLKRTGRQDLGMVQSWYIRGIRVSSGGMYVPDPAQK